MNYSSKQNTLLQVQFLISVLPKSTYQICKLLKKNHSLLWFFVFNSSLRRIWCEKFTGYYTITLRHCDHTKGESQTVHHSLHFILYHFELERMWVFQLANIEPCAIRLLYVSAFRALISVVDHRYEL